MMGRRAISICVLSSLAVAGSADAGRVVLRASVNKTKIAINERFQLTFTVEGVENAPPPNLPPLDDFFVLFGPNTSTQTTIVNGKVSVSISYTYTLKPKAKGKFVIEPAKLRYNRKTYRSQPIQIEVVDQPSKTAGMDLEKRLFVELVVDKTDPYVYEQVTLAEQKIQLQLQYKLP